MRMRLVFTHFELRTLNPGRALLGRENKMAREGGSLVSNILQKSSTLDKKLVENSAQTLARKAGQLKVEMYEHVRQRYVEFQAYVQSLADIREKLRDVDDEYRRLDKKIAGELREKVADSADSRREIEDSLRAVQEKIDFVQRLASIHEELQAAKRNLEACDFSETVGKLAVVSDNLKDLADVGCEAKVFTTLQEEAAMLCSEADMALTEEWKKHVRWSPEPARKNPTFSETLKTQLKVPVGNCAETDGETKALSEIVEACKVLDTWPRMRTAFANKLLQLVLKPVVSNSTLAVKRQIDASKNSVFLRFVEVTEAAEEEEGERISQLYKNLTTVFKLVHQMLLERKEWTREVGQAVCPEMTRLIIDRCLKQNIPKTEEELELYEHVKAATSEFEAALIEMGVVETGFRELSNFTQNIKVYFADQKRKDLLANARSILKKSIHNTEIVTPSENTEPLPYPLGPPSDQQTPQNEAAPEFCLVSEEDQLKDVGATFPVCAVSKCVMEFVELFHQTLCESYSKETSEEKMAVFSTARDMIDLFRAVFPTHHKADVSTIPAAAAVFYNDAMYVVHHLILASAQIQQHLSPHATFVDLILHVRRLGEDAFQAEMKKQRESVLQTVKAFGDFKGVSEEDKRDEVYRCVRQGLFQITQLSRVYKETLPAHMHKGTVGGLLDVLVSHIVKGVLALEDIVSSDATELHQISDVVLEKGTSVMQYDKEQAKDLPLHCASWTQLQELAFVLDARLYEIVERWDEGKGSLAKHFKPVEVRTLIKALFTNTDRRAAALTKITL